MTATIDWIAKAAADLDDVDQVLVVDAWHIASAVARGRIDLEEFVTELEQRLTSMTPDGVDLFTAWWLDVTGDRLDA